jgi:8-oxo-dGTP diphosphatase
MLFDEGGAVLLVRFVVPREEGKFVFWALPGGEIEAGETEAEAAVQEVGEELGLELKVTGPIYRDSNQFLHQGGDAGQCRFSVQGRVRAGGASADRSYGG